MTNISISTPQHTSSIKHTPQTIHKTKSAQTADSVARSLCQEVNKSKNPNYIPSKMLLTLVKSSLSGRKINANAFSGRSYEDWVRMYNLGIENSVLPTMLDGLRKNSNIKVPDDVLKNMKVNENYVKKYHMYQEKVLGEVQDLASKKGIDIVPLKGLGFSLNYPDPQKRFGGDIDVFTFKHGTDFSKPENNMSHKFDDVFQKIGITIKDENPKHSEFEYKGMPIENHRTFLDVNAKYLKVPDAEKMDTYLVKHLKPKQKVLPMGTKILVPSKEFNTVFMAYHSMTHFIGAGINFHHLTDWAVLLNKHGLKVPQEAKGTAIEKFMYAMTNLSNKHLGTKIKVPENKKLEDAIFDKMLDPSNEYNGRKVQKPNTKNPIKILSYKYAVLKNRTKFESSFPEIYKKQSISHIIIDKAKYYLCHPHKISNLLFKYV